MRKTIAFDHENGFWKSRYTFVSSCYGWIKKMFVSAQTVINDKALFWKHDETAPTNNSFYGREPSPSIIAVTFNEDPSTMKIYKALALETSDRRSLASGVNTFRVNPGTGNTISKSVSVGAMSEKGGVLYGHMPGISNISMSDFEYIGVCVDDAKLVEEDESILDDFPEIRPFYDNGADLKYVELGNINGSAATMPSSQITLNPRGIIAGDNVAVSQYFLYDNFLFFLGGVGFSRNKSVFIYNPTGVNSDQPRGFYAEAEFVLGSGDFELFAINLDYEPNRLGPNG